MARYEAFYAPGLADTDSADEDDYSLRLALDWLARAPFPGTPVLVMNAMSMIDNNPLIRWAAQRYPLVSPRSRNRPRGPVGAVLAIWPEQSAFEVAESLAHGKALCVIPGTLLDLSGWIARTGATNLAAPDEASSDLPALDEEVAKTLAFICSYAGHNAFRGASDKAQVIRSLRTIAASTHRPSPELLEQHAVATGNASIRGAAYLRQLYEQVLAGRNFKDYARRTI